MVNKRKLILLLFLSLLIVIGIVGCNSESSSETESAGNDTNSSNNESNKSNQTSNENDEQEPITLQFWGGVPADAGPEAVVDDWNENNPNVQVEYNRYVNDDDGNLKLNTALQTGQNVDIFMTYATNHLQDRVDSNFALDLGQYDDYDIESKMGEKAEQWKIDGSYYAIPTKQNANFIFLNKDALDEAGLSVPEEWTWEELREYASKLSNDDRLGFIYFDPTYNTHIESALVDDGWVNEDGESNFNHPNVKKGLEIMYEMMHTDQSMMPIGEQIATGAAADHMFLSGEVAILSAFEGILRMSNDLDEYPRDFTIAFAPFPNYEGGSQIGHGLGDAISISTNSEYPEEAWEFIKWYADEGMIHQASGGRIPSSADAPIEDAISLMIEGVEDTYDVESLERMFMPGGKLLDSLPLQVSDAVEQEVERYYLGEQSVEDTINNIEERHNQHME